MLAGIFVIMFAAQGVTLGPAPRPAPVQRSSDASVLGAIGAEDANEIEAAKLATSKASNSDVKAFATLLLHDHQQSLSSGTNLAKRFSIVRLLPSDSMLTQAHKQHMIELNVLSGTAFDKAFMQFEVDSHKAALSRDSALMARAVRPQVKEFVRQLIPVHATHQDTGVKWLAAHP